MLARVLLLVYFAGYSFCETNLLRNADFESSNFTGNWYAVGCQMTQSNDAFHGNHSVLMSNRSQSWNGLAQNVNLTAGSRYKTSAYVKLLNTAKNNMYQAVRMMLNCTDSGGKDINVLFGQTPNIQSGQWSEIGGVLLTSSEYRSCLIYIQTDANTDFLVDFASMVLVPADANWKSEAVQRIDKYRKADITIKLVGNVDDTTSVDIELQQTKMEFAFGSAVFADRIVDINSPLYQKVFYDNFEWGVLENALKWPPMERTKGNIDYDRPINAMKAMQSHGTKMRCHCAFWDRLYFVQDWVKALNGSALLNAISNRIQGVTSHTKAMCKQWDINNEMLHGGAFESLTGNPNITMDMFRQMNAADDQLLLYLNDFHVINDPETGVAQKDTAVKYKKAGVPINGIGAQGHMHDVVIDIHVLKSHYDLMTPCVIYVGNKYLGRRKKNDKIFWAKLYEYCTQARLDILAEAGLPIMITELAVNEKNETIRAQKLDDLLTLFFSHPSIKGVLFWGFWDGQIFEKDAPLFNGPNVTPNAAGLVYQNKFHNVWRTNTTSTIKGHLQYQIRAFKGEYTLKVKHNGQVLKTETFTLADGGKTVNVHVTGHTGGIPSVSGVIVG